MTAPAATWRQAREVLDRTLDLDPTRREAVLDEDCGHDALLRTSVEALLDLEDEARREEPPQGPPANDPERWLGRELGAYRLVRELGRGGMGTVYLAERADGEFEAQVAVKVISHSPLHRRQLRERFLVERQILAGLSHPGIARLLDGGTSPEGQPFLVLELVDGEPLDAYCRRHRLSILQRLELFDQVLDAVAYAHRNLVVHLDLKPGNILVTAGDGGPEAVKLLDFGIAQLLSSGMEASGEGGTKVRLTLGYASPEQLQRAPVSTASDVFALGVVLYELLTGRRPFAADESRATPAAIAGSRPQPEPPSRARLASNSRSRAATRAPEPSAGAPPLENLPQGTVSPELDAILLRALAWDPAWRYGSAAALSEDLQRYRRHLPVSAFPGGRLYRARKALRRHRGLATAAFLVVAVLAGGFVARSLEAARANRERDAATAAREQAEELATFMVQDLWVGLEPLGRLDLLEPIARRLRSYYEGRAGDELKPKERLRHAAAFGAVGQVLAHQGELGPAGRALRRQIEILRAPPALDNLSAGTQELGALYSLALTLGDSLEVPEALATWAEMERRGEEIFAEHPGDAAVASYLVDAIDGAGIVLYAQGRLQEALEAFLRAEARFRQLFPIGSREEPLAQDSLVTLSAVQLHLGVVRGELGAREQALEHYRRAAEISDGLWSDDPDSFFALNARILPRTQQAQLLRQLGRAREGIPLIQEVLAPARKIAAADPGNAEARYQLTLLVLELAETRRGIGEGDAARRLWREVITLTDPFGASSEHKYLVDSRVRALLALDRRWEAEGPARALLAQGWNPQGFVELCRRHGIEASGRTAGAALEDRPAGLGGE